MKISEIYKSKKTILSFEIFPPKKDEELDNIEPTLEILSDLHPDYISVTFGAGGHANNSKTICLARKIKEKYNIEPVVHLTGLYYDKNEIDDFAKEIKDAGIENILALRGDINPNVPKKDVFPHASDLITYLKGSYDFCIAGACYPEIHPESEGRIDEMKNLKKKVDAGAELLLSQLFFNNKTFYDFTETCRIAGMDIPILDGSFSSSTNALSTDSCGTIPVIIRYITAPNAYTSVHEPCLPWLLYCSGGAKPCFNMILRLFSSGLEYLAAPKSISLTCPSSVTKILSGAISL